MTHLLQFPLSLAAIETGTFILGLLVAAIAGGAVSFVLVGMLGGKTLAAARTEAESIVSEARREGETSKKQIELDFREELSAKRDAFEKEIAATRDEMKETERRIAKREDNLDRKLDVLSTKEKSLDQLEARLKERNATIENKEAQIDDLLEQQRNQLLNIAGLSVEDAKRLLLERVETECKHEAGRIVQREMAKAEEEAKENAQKITLQAIQRFAAEHTSVSTVSAVDIPSDDMKGRVIGREGRNIRAFEKATGVDVIVDDTPGVVIVSCFDPVRRAVAAESLQRLIEDGRIHPSRIEEIVEQVNKEMEERLVKFGKEACIEANIQGLHPKISAMMGRLYYRTSYGQNILRHSIEVAYLCQVIADELGLDGTIARRCGFLHDIGKAMDHEVEGGHPQIGMDFARKFNESEAVLNAIGGHHGDIESTTPYTPIVMAADAISGARPGARRETLERYVKRLEQLEGIATSFDGVKEAYAIQAGREVRVIVDAKRIDDALSAKVARDIANRVEQEMTYPGEVRVTVLRETRSVEYAR
ncbi:MAG: ribonuclease Y [Planctomycetes bacterium]|nr:ribonuclease Y [Planctomycetota bacterium]